MAQIKCFKEYDYWKFQLPFFFFTLFSWVKNEQLLATWRVCLGGSSITPFVHYNHFNKSKAYIRQPPAPMCANKVTEN